MCLSCMHACVCVHMLVSDKYIFNYKQVRRFILYACMRMGVFVDRVCMHACMYVCMFACMYVRMYMCMYMVVFDTHTYTCMHAYIHTYISRVQSNACMWWCLTRARACSYAILITYHVCRAMHVYAVMRSLLHITCAEQ